MATVTGGAGVDSLTGGTGPDLLLGLGGDDTLSGGLGDDTLDAGTGTAESLFGGTGRDRAVLDRSAATAGLTLYVLAPDQATTLDATRITGVEEVHLRTGSGDDRLVGGEGDDLFDAGAGRDALQGGAGADTLLGGAGEDTLAGGAGADALTGGAGADRFLLTLAGEAPGATLATPDRITDFSRAEGDRFALRGQAVAGALQPLAGGAGVFALPGGTPLPIGFAGSLAAAEAPVAGLGLPDPTGGAAFQVFWLPSARAGDPGGWVLLDADRDGQLGAADLVLRIDLTPPGGITAEDFAPGSFALLGTSGADARTGGAADDTLHGFAGADTLAGAAGQDSALGGAEADSLAGGAGFDTLRGEAGADSLAGEADADLLDGGEGEDRLDGGDGRDLLLGGPGADLLIGGAGEDTLQAGPGADTLTGGAGADLFVVQAMGEAAWSTLGAMARIADFDRAGGDRIRLSDAWVGLADGRGATAGLFAGPDGIARPLIFAASLAEAQTELVAGLRLPTQGGFAGLAGAYQLFWVPARTAGGQPAGGWLVLDLDQDAQLGTADLVVRVGDAGAPVTIGPADLAEGTLFRLGTPPAAAPAGTAGDDRLGGGSFTETFAGTTGSDSLSGGAGAPNAVTYAGLAGAVRFVAEGAGAGRVEKTVGGTDRLGAIHALSGTAGADTLDASALAAEGPYVLSLEGRGGSDRLVGSAAVPHAVQASYAASPAAVVVDLAAGTADDGWGGTDWLEGIRRVAATSPWNDTVRGTAGDDVFLSATQGSKLFDGGAGGLDEYRYAGTGSVRIALMAEISGLFRLDPRAVKPDGTDRLIGIEAAVGGAGDDTILGGEADERIAGGPGHDSLDGGPGLDTLVFDGVSAAAGLPSRGVVADLVAGTATDAWGGTDIARNFESAWGSQLSDSLTARGVPEVVTTLRGLGGDDTLTASGLNSLVTADHGADPAGVRMDLGAGWALDGFGGRDRLVRIAHANGSAFADSLAGSAAAGNRLEGGAGDDTLEGKAGADTLVGGPGDDLLIVEEALDQVIEWDGGGTDTLLAALSAQLPAWVEHLTLMARLGNLSGTGNPLDNRILGNEGANLLRGAAGADTLDGGAGDDRLQGEEGDDSLLGGAGADAIEGGDGADTLDGGEGNDSLLGEAGLARILGGAGADTLVGGTLADTLDGGTEDDRLSGLGGADSLLGGAGTDALWGGEGADTLDGGEGRDSLAGEAGADRLSGGPGADTLQGDGEDDTLEGGADGDQLFGNAGHDVLAGLDGADRLVGGDGDDRLLGDDGIAVLAGDPAAGDLFGGGALPVAPGGEDPGPPAWLAEGDRVWAVIGLSRLSGETWLYAAAGADTLVGPDGDSLFGGEGADTLDGGLGGDAVHGERGDDLLFGGAGAFSDLLVGGDGHDTLDGSGHPGSGPRHLGELDVMQGGRGNDLYIADTPFDLTVETGDEGHDTVFAIVPGGGYLLLAHVEDLFLFGGTVFGAGNPLDNRLVGDGSRNWLLGGAGNDTLDGQGAEDVLLGQSGADVFVLRRGGGADVIGDFEPGVDRLRLEGFGFRSEAEVMGALGRLGQHATLDLGFGEVAILRNLGSWVPQAGDLLLG